MKHTNVVKRRNSNLKLAGIGVTFLTVVMLGVLYAMAEKPIKATSQMISGMSNSNTEISSSENAIIYNEEIQGVIVKLKTEDNSITIHDCNTNQDITLKLNGGANILDKYGEYIAVSQLSVGMIVDVYYLEEESKLVKLQISPDAFEKIGVTNVIMNEADGIFSFNGQRYPLSDGVVAIQDSKVISLSDIKSMDYVNVKGINDEICAVVVTKGHGYLELANDEEYIGGNIEVGSLDSVQITKDLLMTVREGTYTVTVTNGELKGSKEITIVKNKTSVFDLIDYGKPAESIGLVRFDISPANAVLYIDGKTMDYQSPIELTYGTHELEVSLGGYITYQGNIDVVSTDKTIRIVLPKNTAGNTSSDTIVNETDSGTNNNSGVTDDTSNNTDTTTDTEQDTNSQDDTDTSEDTDNSTEDTDTTEEENGSDTTEEETEYEEDTETTPGVDASNTMTITCTNGTKVYIDDTYIGSISDGKLETKKYYGKHTIELVLNGYEKKSYTINLDNDGENATLNFPSF